MPLNIRNEDSNRLAEKLARRLHLTKTAAVKRAHRAEPDRLEQSVPLQGRLRPLQDRVQSYPQTGLEADKAFYDALSGHEGPFTLPFKIDPS